VSAGPSLLELDDLRVHIPITRGVVFRRAAGTVQAVDGVSLAVDRGRTLGLVGESGSGKTTLGRAVVGLQRPTSGRVVFDGQDLWRLDRTQLRGARRRMGAVFQDPYASLDPRMRVASIVGEPLDVHRVGSRHERRTRVEELLGIVGLHRRHADRYPHELSGGQRQRVGIARALSLDPALVVADEPVSALDVSIQAQIVNLLRRLQDDLGLAYVFIAHDLAVVRHVSDRVAVMYLGRIVEEAPTPVLFSEPRHPYTVALLSSIPVPDPARERRRRRIVLHGEVPSAAAPPSGCRFHPRCWLRERLGRPEECERSDPALRSVGADHAAACHFAERVTETADAAAPITA
jgi:oligopeptide/dipeptide ABC transporter ATP-binding protein